MRNFISNLSLDILIKRSVLYHPLYYVVVIRIGPALQVSPHYALCQEVNIEVLSLVKCIYLGHR